MAKGFKGFPGGGGNMGSLMQQAQKMQKELEKAQAETATMAGSGTAGGGMVTATVDSNHQLTELVIKPEIIDPEDAEMLTDLIIAAVNGACADLDEKVGARMGRVTGGGLPGFGF